MAHVHVRGVLSHRNWSPGPSTANCVAVDGPPDQLWLPWMIRFAASGPPAENQLMVKINLGWQHYLITKPCAVGVCCNSGSQIGVIWAAHYRYAFLLVKNSMTRF